MKIAGRVQAAIEVLHEVLTRHRPAAEALKDWGKAHRFAGSGDRHAIGTLVYDSLRQRSSAAAQGGGDTARQIVFGMLKQSGTMSLDDIASLADGQHGPAVLTTEETTALKVIPTNLPWHVVANVPEWLAPVFEKLFGKAAAAEGQALSQRAPIDLRVNTLKSDPLTLRALISTFNPSLGPWVKTSLRIAAPSPEQKHINVEVDPAHGQGCNPHAQPWSAARAQQPESAGSLVCCGFGEQEAQHGGHRGRPKPDGVGAHRRLCARADSGPG